MPKLTLENEEQIQAILCQKSLGEVKKRQKLLRHKKNLQIIKMLEDSSSVPILGRMAGAVSTTLLPGGKGQEVERRLEKRKHRAGTDIKLRRIDLTAEEAEILNAKIRGVR